MSNWPTHSDYQDAMQNPSACFQEEELKTGEARTDAMGLPRVMSGNFASVYELRCPPQQRWAIRCFVRQVPGQQGRYARLCQHLNSLSMPYLVGFDYMLKGVLVRGEWYPIVKMQWVEGTPLNTWVEDNLNNPEALRKLAADWIAMMQELAKHKIAHGDLQHGNIMVTPNNELRLVDYDGMYAPVFGRGRAPELGHINFQHPRRTGDFYQEDLDNFSGTVIYMSLLALAADPSLWQQHYTVDNLVLCSADYKNPLNSAPLTKLKQSSDPKVQQLAKHIEKCCLQPVENVPDFAEVIKALEAGTLESLPAKTPVAASTVSFQKPAAAGSAPAGAPATGSRPAPAAAPAAPAGKNVSRSAYDGATTVATQSLKKTQTATPKSPGYVQPPPAEKSGGIPGWAWGIAGAIIMAVIALIAYSMMNKKDHSMEEESPPATEVVTAPSAPAAAPTPVAAVPQPVNKFKVTPLGTLKGHGAEVNVVAFSPDGKTLASGSADKSVRLWDVQAGAVRHTLAGSADSLTSVTFLPDGKTVAGVSADNIVHFWDAASGKEQRTLTDLQDNLFPVVVSPNGQVLATGSSSDRKAVRLVGVTDNADKQKLSGHSSWVKSVVFSPNSALLLSTCHDDSIHLWSVIEENHLATLNITGNAIEIPAFSPNGKTVATGANGNTIKLWETVTGALHQSFSGHNGEVKCCTFSPDGKTLASGGTDMTVKLWDVASGAEKETLKGHTAAVLAVTFSTDGKMLASSSADQTIRLYEIQN